MSAQPSEREEIVLLVSAGMDRYYREDIPEDDLSEHECIADAILESDWLARIKRGER